MITVPISKDKLHAIMEAQGLNGSTLAQRMGKEQTHIWNIINKKACSEKTLMCLCSALNVEPEDVAALPARLTIGQSMWLQRVKHHLTISQLARLSRENEDRLRDYENDRGDITVLEATTIADAYGITLDELLLFKPNK